jgi:hypothetical protein
MTTKLSLFAIAFSLIFNHVNAAILTTEVLKNTQKLYLDGEIVFEGDSVSEHAIFIDFQVGHTIYTGVLVDGNRGTGTLQRILVFLEKKSGLLMAIPYDFVVDDALIKLKSITGPVQCGDFGVGFKKTYFIEKKYTTPKCKQKTELYICKDVLRNSVCASSSAAIDLNACIEQEGKYVDYLMEQAEITLKSCALD